MNWWERKDHYLAYLHLLSTVKMDRKEFLSTGVILGTAAFAPGCSSQQSGRISEAISNDLSDIPICCSHEHWGSIFNIGYRPEGFVADLLPGALPARKTTLVDLLLDPYLTGNLRGNGIDPLDFKDGQNSVNLMEKSDLEPVETFKTLIQPLKNFRLKGTYQSIRMGVNFAYGYDIHAFDPDQLRIADIVIGENYRNMFSWYEELMTKAALSDLIRPVQPEFYFGDFDTGPAQKEMSFTLTVLRIDPFLDFWKETNDRRDNLACKLEIDPVDARSWRDFLEKIFSFAAEHSCIGIKQLQAYMRSLEFSTVSESDVRFRGDLSDKEVKEFQDWIMHTCCELANQRKWPHQIHVGTHNHPDSNPLPLETLAKMYPDQKIVMLHCWPYLEESGFLAQAYPNVYIDTCWQPVLNPYFLRQSLDTWLGYIPLNKITMSNDSTSVEMATGASLITRKVLASALTKQKESAGLSQGEVREIAAQLLHNNAVEIYGIGQSYH